MQCRDVLPTSFDISSDKHEKEVFMFFTNNTVMLSLLLLFKPDNDFFLAFRQWRGTVSGVENEVYLFSCPLEINSFALLASAFTGFCMVVGYCVVVM